MSTYLRDYLLWHEFGFILLDKFVVFVYFILDPLTNDPEFAIFTNEF